MIGVCIPRQSASHYSYMQKLTDLGYHAMVSVAERYLGRTRTVSAT